MALVALLAGAGCTSETGDTTPAREGRTPSGLAYDISGSGPPIVLIHGAMLDRRQWQPQRALAEQFTVIAYDTRWHGRSAGADSAFSAADDLAAVMDAAGVQSASIVGLSNGAKIAADFALQYPSRVARLVLASPGLGGYVATERPTYFLPMIEALTAKDFAAAAAALANTPVMEVGSADSAWVATMVREQASVFQQDPSREQPPTPPAISRLNEIRVPVLVITGDADMRDIILTGDTLVRSIAGARRATIAGAKHMLNITHALQFNALVAEFLAQPAKQ